MIRARAKHRRNRRKMTPNAYPAGTAAIAVPTIVATKARLTFDVPVVVSGLPISITDEGNPPTSVTVVSPTVVDLGYAAAVVSTDVLVIPGNVLQIRTSTGGFVAAASYTFP